MLKIICIGNRLTTIRRVGNVVDVSVYLITSDVYSYDINKRFENVDTFTGFDEYAKFIETVVYRNVINKTSDLTIIKDVKQFLVLVTSKEVYNIGLDYFRGMSYIQIPTEYLNNDDEYKTINDFLNDKKLLVREYMFATSISDTNPIVNKTETAILEGPPTTAIDKTIDVVKDLNALKNKHELDVNNLRKYIELLTLL